jgi:hypothetical protein
MPEANYTPCHVVTMDGGALRETTHSRGNQRSGLRQYPIFPRLTALFLYCEIVVKTCSYNQV